MPSATLWDLALSRRPRSGMLTKLRHRTALVVGASPRGKDFNRVTAIADEQQDSMKSRGHNNAMMWTRASLIDTPRRGGRARYGER